MSTPPDDTGAKTGHSPAVKAGGMRIVQHKHAAGDKPESMTPEEEAEYGSPPKSDKHHQSILVAGVVTKGDKDFSSDAVKSFHDKTIPVVEKRPTHAQHNINQPRKN